MLFYSAFFLNYKIGFGLLFYSANVDVVVTPNWGVSELCTSDTPKGVTVTLTYNRKQ